MYMLHITTKKTYTCVGCGVQSVVNYIEESVFTKQAGKVYCRGCATDYNIFPRAREIEISYYKKMRRIFNIMLVEAERIGINIEVFKNYPTIEGVTTFLIMVTTYDDSNIKVLEGRTKEKTPIGYMKFNIYVTKYSDKTGGHKHKELYDYITIYEGTYDVFYEYIRHEFMKMKLGVFEKQENLK